MKKGDRVKVTGEASGHKGRLATVTGMRIVGAGPLLGATEVVVTMDGRGETKGWIFRGDDLEVVTAETETSYVCSACGVLPGALLDSIESGTTLTCSECGGETVIDLATPEQMS